MIKLHVEGMTCGHCARRVTQAIHIMDPGAQVDIDLKNKHVLVESQETSAELFAEAICEAGYKVLPMSTMHQRSITLHRFRL